MQINKAKQDYENCPDEGWKIQRLREWCRVFTELLRLAPDTRTVVALREYIPPQPGMSDLLNARWDITIVSDFNRIRSLSMAKEVCQFAAGINDSIYEKSLAMWNDYSMIEMEKAKKPAESKAVYLRSPKGTKSQHDSYQKWYRQSMQAIKAANTPLRLDVALSESPYTPSMIITASYCRDIILSSMK